MAYSCKFHLSGFYARPICLFLLVCPSFCPSNILSFALCACSLVPLPSFSFVLLYTRPLFTLASCLALHSLQLPFLLSYSWTNIPLPVGDSIVDTVAPRSFKTEDLDDMRPQGQHISDRLTVEVDCRSLGPSECPSMTSSFSPLESIE